MLSGAFVFQNCMHQSLFCFILLLSGARVTKSCWEYMTSLQSALVMAEIPFWTCTCEEVYAYFLGCFHVCIYLFIYLWPMWNSWGGLVLQNADKLVEGSNLWLNPSPFSADVKWGMVCWRGICCKMWVVFKITSIGSWLHCRLVWLLYRMDHLIISQITTLFLFLISVAWKELTVLMVTCLSTWRQCSRYSVLKIHENQQHLWSRMNKKINQNFLFMLSTVFIYYWCLCAHSISSHMLFGSMFTSVT